MASTYLSRTTSTAGNGQRFTISGWFKKSSATEEGEIINCYGGNTSDANVFHWGWISGGAGLSTLSISLYSGTHILRTNRKFRDTSAWYHLVLAVDTTQATDTNRLKLYVNGVQETSFQDTNYPVQNYSYVFGLGSSKMFTIGSQTYDGGSNYNRFFNGSMAHVHFIDGTAYDASTFGETDATTGIWKPIFAPSVTYGTNGFFLKFENSGSMGTDSSGNANNFTVNGTMTQNIDTPSNVFATMNPLVPTTALNFSNGDTTLTGTNATNYASNNTSTFGVSSGKYYFEIEYDTAGSNNFSSIGISPISISATTNPTGALNDVILVTMENQLYVEGTNSASYLGSTPTTGDIIQIALDMDNGKVFFGLNGTFVGDPVAGTGGAFSGITSGETIALNIRPLDAVFKCNFGNGYFGTTAVASAQNPDDGIGIFEYSVPTGYKALCTKSINAQEYS